jgi:hypothetical protein
MREGSLGDASVFANVVSEVRDGRRVPAERRNTFPDAHFHLPGELHEELTDAGLTVEAILPIEGPGALLPDLDQRWDSDDRQTLVRLAREAEPSQTLLALSPHLLAAGRT